jgi:protein tyrosine/serine phosphatase
MKTVVRGALGLGIAILLIGAPLVYWRFMYHHGKRLREVVPGVLYRSGQLSIDGFADAVIRYRIRTIVNVQDDYPDPDVEKHWFNRGTIKESELCRQLGVRYVQLSPDLVPRRDVPHGRPKVIDQFLAVMDDPDNHPVLLHCKAGLHRTGVLSAVFRMEYQGWSPDLALRELRAMGFGEFASSSANDYITQYILTYQRGLRGQESGGRGQGAGVRSQGGCLPPAG